MSLIAEFHVSGADLPVTAALDAVPELTLEVEQAIAEDPRRPVLFVWARGDDFPTFEAAAADDPTVGRLTVLDEADERRLYRIAVRSRRNAVLYPTDLEVGSSRLSVSATHRGLDVRMRFPDRGSMREYFDICREKGHSVSLSAVYGGESPERPYDLSRKQRETLRRALAGGYYGVPRETELAELSAALGVSRQAVSERLRRATATLIENAVGVSDASEPEDGDRPAVRPNAGRE